MLSDALKSEIRALTARYPHPKGAMLMALHRVREAFGKIPRECHAEVAGLLGVEPIEVEEVVTFYPLLEVQPKGRHVVHVCTTLSCMLGGCRKLLDHIEEKHGARLGGTSKDGSFTLYGAQCIGSCDRAPAVLVDLEQVARATPEKFDAIVASLNGARYVGEAAS